MKIIINRSFGNYLTRVIVFKNGEEVITCSVKEDFCSLNTIEGDKILIKLKYLTSSSISIASFICSDNAEVIVISPTFLAKWWAVINYALLPYLCLLLLALKPAISSEAYSWVCAGTVCLTAISLIVSQVCMQFSSLRKMLLQTSVL